MAEVQLSSNIGNVNKWLDGIAERLSKLDDELLQKVCAKAVERAREFLSQYATGVDVSALLGKISYRETDNGYAITAEGKDLYFLEYGTGLRGSHTPHRYASSIGWNYETGETIIQNPNSKYYRMWKYPSANSEYTTDSDIVSQGGINGRPAIWTYGVPASMFMYRTYQALPSIINNVIKEIKIV